MIKKNPLPSSDLLLTMFCYDAETGVLTWRVDKGRAKQGDVAGKPNASGHLAFRLNGVNYLAHRIIWKMMTGQDPLDEIDHKDVNGSNNKWDNLRESNRPQNMANVRAPVTNKSGVKNVNFHCGHKKWHAKLRTNNQFKHIGYFDTIEAAAAAIAEARSRINGEFARAA
jgi:hypothetical protein